MIIVFNKITLRNSMAVMAISILMVLSSPAGALADKTSKSTDQQNVQNDINQLNVSLAETVEKYEAEAARLDELNAAIATNQADLQEKVHSLVVATDILDKRAVGIYKHGSVSSLEVIFNSKNFDDFIQQLDLLMRVGSRDADIVKQVDAQKKEVETKAKQLDAQQKEQEKLTDEMALERDQIEEQLSDKTSVLASIIQDIADLDAAEAERIAKERVARGNQRGGATLYDVLPGLSGRWSVGSGPLGPGEWSDHGGSGHGVWLGADAFDLDAPASTPVYAAHSGTIRSIGYERYGVTKLEGEGFVTLYAHCEPLTYVGQYVSAGDIIATVAYGHDGWYQHLHLEMLDNGEAIPAGDYQSYF